MVKQCLSEALLSSFTPDVAQQFHSRLKACNRSMGYSAEWAYALIDLAHFLPHTGCSHPHLSFGFMALILGSSSQVMLH